MTGKKTSSNHFPLSHFISFTFSLSPIHTHAHTCIHRPTVHTARINIMLLMHATVNAVILGVQRWLMLLVPLVFFLYFPVLSSYTHRSGCFSFWMFVCIYTCMLYILCINVWPCIVYGVWRGMAWHGIAQHSISIVIVCIFWVKINIS